jgi:mono/diheme cytochrome c family protein
MRSRHLALALVVLALATSGYWAQEKQKQQSEEKKQTQGTLQASPVPHVLTISPEAAAQKNPVRFSEVSVERGRKLFQTQCAMCHGEKADGKGEVAEEMKINPPDFTKPDDLSKRTDGELHSIINSGSLVMPGQTKRMEDRHVWDLVNYLRAVSGKTPLNPTEQELQEGTVEVKKHP